jgi:N-acetylglucosamine kinase-like BadF-type ATPase
MPFQDFKNIFPKQEQEKKKHITFTLSTVSQKILMLLVVDSGSTKADWCLINKDNTISEFSTIGFNPYFQKEETILAELQKSSLIPFAETVKELFFFGAGCSSPQLNKIVSDALQKFFVHADIHVEHDMLGSALATCGDEPGISCILGTGSNSCYFDGKKVHENNYGLGYIIGDEGSGSYYGKKLVAYYLYGILPGHLQKEFGKLYPITKDSLIQTVYNNSNANVYLASFARFLSDRKEDEYVQQLVRQGMLEFFDVCVSHYKNYKTLQVHFVGSIAFYFENVLREVAFDKDIHVGKVIKKPIGELTKYFIQKNGNR